MAVDKLIEDVLSLETNSLGVRDCIEYVREHTGLSVSPEFFHKKAAELGFLPEKSATNAGKQTCTFKSEQVYALTKHIHDLKEKALEERLKNLERIILFKDDLGMESHVSYNPNVNPAHSYTNQVILALKTYYDRMNLSDAQIKEKLGSITIAGNYSIDDIMEVMCLKSVTIQNFLKTGIFKIVLVPDKIIKAENVKLRGKYVRRVYETALNKSSARFLYSDIIKLHKELYYDATVDESGKHL